MCRLTPDRVARSSRPGRARPGDARIAPMLRTVPSPSAAKGFVRSRRGHAACDPPAFVQTRFGRAASVPSGFVRTPPGTAACLQPVFVRTAPKPPPNRAALPAPGTPPPEAKRSHPLPICPIARRRAAQRPAKRPENTPRPQRTPICPITLPPAPFATPARVCPNAPSTRATLKLRTIRARQEGSARPARERPVTPPSDARPTRRPDLRAPARRGPLAP
jgi:hypothetical protein